MLDSNVVLDWLLFADPRVQALAAWLSAGSGRWLVSEALRGELAHVLSRPPLDQHADRLPALWAAWDRHATTVDARTLTGAALRLRCRDADDQKFIDLALAHGARWLVSRDKDVLKLARRARALGLHIVTPGAWSPDAPEPGAA